MPRIKKIEVQEPMVNVQPEPIKMNLKDRIKKNPVLWGMGLLLVIALVFGGYTFKRLQDLQRDPQLLSQQQDRKIIARVGRLMVLPENEQPTVATVADPEKLQDQPFLKNAKKGDKILIYTIAKKAILYDPVIDKILDIAPVNINTTANTSSLEQSPLNPFKDQK